MLLQLVCECCEYMLLQDYFVHPNSTKAGEAIVGIADQGLAN